VINGGDGSHEHPTQTLCDLFTLKQKNRHLRNLKVAISGDLKGSRTIHSFVYALARFGATIMPMPAKGMELPAHVDERLREEFGCHIVPVPKGKGDDSAIDVLYVTPEEPHQQSLFSGPEIERGRDIGLVELPEGTLHRQGSALPPHRSQVPERAEILRGQRDASAAARRGTGR
jgi:aspartate carbamoyltransferase catalytic subunit